MSQRRCACGCKRSLEGMRADAIWASRACAVRWARENPGKSLYDARKANRGRTRHASGPQVAYLKTVKALRENPAEDPVVILTRCLSRRQRERLGSSTARERKAA